MKNKIYVIYWSQSGNTWCMAEAIGKGIEKMGKQAVLMDVSQIFPEELENEKVFALECPSMGSEILEESQMGPFVEAVEKFAVLNI